MGPLLASLEAKILDIDMNISWDDLLRSESFHKNCILGLSIFTLLYLYHKIKINQIRKLETNRNKSNILYWNNGYFMYGIQFSISIFQWMNILYHIYYKKEEWKIEKKVDFTDIFFTYIFVYGILMDIFIGMDYYPKQLYERKDQHMIQVVLGIVSLMKKDIKFYMLNWISNYPDLLKNMNQYYFIKNDKIDVRIYQMSVILFKLIYPFILLKIYYTNVSTEFFVIYAISIWYEVCKFIVWSIDNLIFKNVDKIKTQ
jgi:hypothetical protein